LNPITFIFRNVVQYRFCS